MLFSKKKPLVAVDIGGYSIKVVNLKKIQNGYELLNLGMTRLPPDSVVDGEIENPEAVIIALESLLKTEGISNRNVVMSVSGQSVVIKKISVPQMGEDELAEMIREEAEQYLPFDIDEVNLDFQIIKKITLSDGADGTDEAEADMDVLIVAARKDMVKVYQDVAAKTGLKMRVLDLDAFAIENAYEFTHEPELETAVALVNIGASMTNINILEEGVTAFTRDLHGGGNNISEEIQKNLQVSFSDAEKYKLGILDDRFTKDEITPHILNGLELLCREIGNLFDIFHKTSEYKISRIYLSGGTCRMENIDSLVEKYTGITSECMTPFSGISYNEENIDPEYIAEMNTVMTLPVGLAIRMLGEK
jgi:type IV pilus assembly protein PilM